MSLSQKFREVGVEMEKKKKRERSGSINNKYLILGVEQPLPFEDEENSRRKLGNSTVSRHLKTKK